MKYWSVLLTIILTGCATSVPTSKIRIGNVEFVLPKDFKATDFNAEVKMGTNHVKVTAKEISNINNPLVIGMSTEQIKAHYSGAGDFFKMALDAAKSGKVIP